jgi:hypothetical protein
MLKWSLALVIGISVAAWSQEDAVTMTPIQASSLSGSLGKGTVEDRTYKNVSLGLELTPDPELKLGTPTLKGTPGTLPLIVIVAAWGEEKPFSARKGMVFYADTLAYYPADQRSTNAYMRKMIRANRNDGFEVAHALEGRLGGVSFARTDFFKRGPAYESVFVRACATRALVFVFTGSDQDAVNKTIARTELKLDLPNSGCEMNSLQK